MGSITVPEPAEGGKIYNTRVVLSPDICEINKNRIDYVECEILMWNKIGRIVTLLSELLDITSEGTVQEQRNVYMALRHYYIRLVICIS